jgi:hypothetical protein
MNEATFSALIERLNRLERAYRWWKLLGSCALGVLGMLLFLGATTERPADEIRARRFIVIGENAQPRAVLGAWKLHNSCLTLIAEDGRKRAELSLLPDDGSPALSLYDRAGLRRGFLSVDDSGAAASQIQLISNKGARIDLGAWTDMGI